MRTTQTQTYHETTLEEFGPRRSLTIDLLATCDVLPGEPMVRYYRDGSGYPGSPSATDFVSARVLSICGENYFFRRDDRPDWFAVADHIVAAAIVADDRLRESIEGESLESAEIEASI